MNVPTLTDVRAGVTGKVKQVATSGSMILEGGIKKISLLF
jgi:hypothetical protein